jgi:amino acid transporter
MTAELGTMMPDMGGPIVWVDRAFGRRVAHSNAIIRLVANFFDLALYPVMFADYLRELHPMLKLEGVHRYLLSASLVGAVTLLNVAGVDAVASVSTVFTVLVISPFAALVIYGLPRVDPSAWLIGLNPAEWSSLGGVGGGESTVGPYRWGTYFSVLLWNMSGYDSVGALAAEVADPGRDFPRAMGATIILVSLVYIVPVAVGVSLDDPAHLPKWSDGTFAVVAEDHVGPWLAKWISLGGALSACGLLNMQVLTTAPLPLPTGALSAFGLLNMRVCAVARIAVSAAEIGVLPRALAHVDEHSGAPVTAIVVLSTGLLCMLSLPFAALVKFSMLFYGATVGTALLALVKLRKSEPTAPRPYRVPIADGYPLIAFCMPPLALCVLLAFVAERASLYILLGVLAVASLAWSCKGEQPSYSTLPSPRNSQM